MCDWMFQPWCMWYCTASVHKKVIRRDCIHAHYPRSCKEILSASVSTNNDGFVRNKKKKMCLFIGSLAIISHSYNTYQYSIVGVVSGNMLSPWAKTYCSQYIIKSLTRKISCFSFQHAQSSVAGSQGQRRNFTQLCLFNEVRRHDTLTFYRHL
jgi:hypothetical protein